MEPLEFLGGKYQHATQILPGTLQTFRAVDPSAGRDVFVHRVPANDPAAHQLALLLSSALIRSAKARNLVLDVVEADGFAYVVTDTEHQCLLLREWLQFEINQAGGAEPSARSAAPATPVESKQPSLEDTDPKLPADDETKAQPSAPSPEPAKREVGEFTRMFMAGTAAAQKEAPPAASKPTSDASPSKPAAEAPPSKPAAPAAAPGEFTRFFQAPNAPEKKATPEPVRTAERPTNPDLGRTSFVQRPSTPAPTPPAPGQKSNDPGEFTRMFMQGAFTPTPAPPPSMPSISPSPTRDPFAPSGGGGMFSESKPVVPEPAAKPMGEYTRIFGAGNEAPPIQQPSSVAAPPPPLTDDPLLRSGGPVPATPPAAQAAPARGPSEYTLVMSGRPSEAAPTNAPISASSHSGAPPAGAASPGSIPLPQMQVNVAPPNPMQGLHVPPPPAAHAGGGGMAASGLGGSASAQVAAPRIPAATPPPMNFQSPAALKAPTAPAGVPVQSKNKLVILFAILGVLAILLVILIVLLLKK